MQIEIRSDHVHISGYVNAVDRVSRVMKDSNGVPFVEKIEPGTFQRSIDRGSEIFIKHNHERVVSSTKESGVTLKEDNIGLRCEADIYDAEVIERARNRELVGWSFGFTPLKAERTETDVEGAEYERKISDLELREVSIIDSRKMPCYAATSIECRAFEEEAKYSEIEDEKKPTKPDFSLRKKRLDLYSK
jgi:hypothetical protein